MVLSKLNEKKLSHIIYSRIHYRRFNYGVRNTWHKNSRPFFGDNHRSMERNYHHHSGVNSCGIFFWRSARGQKTKIMDPTRNSFVIGVLRYVNLLFKNAGPRNILNLSLRYKGVMVFCVAFHAASIFPRLIYHLYNPQPD